MNKTKDVWEEILFLTLKQYPLSMQEDITRICKQNEEMVKKYYSPKERFEWVKQTYQSLKIIEPVGLS